MYIYHFLQNKETNSPVSQCDYNIGNRPSSSCPKHGSNCKNVWVISNLWCRTLCLSKLPCHVRSITKETSLKVNELIVINVLLSHDYLVCMKSVFNCVRPNIFVSTKRNEKITFWQLPSNCVTFDLPLRSQNLT